MGQLAFFESNGEEDFSSFKYCKPGPRMGYEDAVAFIKMKGGQMLNLEEARAYINSRDQSPYHGED